MELMANAQEDKGLTMRQNTWLEAEQLWTYLFC